MRGTCCSKTHSNQALICREANHNSPLTQIAQTNFSWVTAYGGMGIICEETFYQQMSLYMRIGVLISKLFFFLFIADLHNVKKIKLSLPVVHDIHSCERIQWKVKFMLSSQSITVLADTCFSAMKRLRSWTTLFK